MPSDPGYGQSLAVIFKHFDSFRFGLNLQAGPHKIQSYSPDELNEICLHGKESLAFIIVNLILHGLP